MEERLSAINETVQSERHRRSTRRRTRALAAAMHELEDIAAATKKEIAAEKAAIAVEKKEIAAEKADIAAIAAEKKEIAAEKAAIAAEKERVS